MFCVQEDADGVVEDCGDEVGGGEGIGFLADGVWGDEGEVCGRGRGVRVLGDLTHPESRCIGSGFSVSGGNLGQTCKAQLSDLFDVLLAICIEAGYLYREGRRNV